VLPERNAQDNAATRAPPMWRCAAGANAPHGWGSLAAMTPLNRPGGPESRPQVGEGQRVILAARHGLWLGVVVLAKDSAGAGRLKLRRKKAGRPGGRPVG